MLESSIVRELRLCSLPVTERFTLDPITRRALLKEPAWGYGPFSEYVFYSRWSRPRPDGQRETWGQALIRVIEGVMSIAKQFHRDYDLPWDEAEMALFAREMALAAWRGEWGPPGRGFWYMGTDLMYSFGGLPLSNCAFVDVTSLAKGAHFLADALMVGAGVGFSTWHDVTSSLQLPRTGTRQAIVFCPEDDRRKGYPTQTYQQARALWDTVDRLVIVIPDSREGWVDATTLLIESYETGGPEIRFDYSRIRPAGTPIRGFGGTSTGPAPLRLLHRKLRIILDHAVTERWPNSLVIADVMNLIGCMVVAGNVRRSAQICLGSPDDPVFADLKNYERFPYRRRHGWASNNSYVLRSREDFRVLPAVAGGIKRNGEPGIFNLLNVRKFGRLGDRAGTRLSTGTVIQEDSATGVNPCVPGETRILTRHGYERIDALVGVPTEVWNGQEWSLVIPRVTGHHQPMVRVSFSDGTALRVTRAHRFHLARGYQALAPEVVPAADLRPGDMLWKYAMPVVTDGEAIDSAIAYSQGVFAGDGHHEHGRPYVFLYGKKAALAEGLASRSQRYQASQDRLRVALDQEVCHDRTFVPLSWDLDGRLAWFAGLLDTDGHVTKDGNIQIVSADRAFLQETRLMLTTLGCQAKVSRERDARQAILPDGHGGKRPYQMQPAWRLMLSAADAVQLRDLGIGTYLRRIDLSTINPQRDARRFVTVTAVEEDGIEETVYCFTEPHNHTGTFEGIVTGQCGEACLESYETCVLAEVYPTRCLDDQNVFDDERFLAACRYAAFYTATVQLLPTHRPETNAVIARNRRTGISLAGVAALRDLLSMTELVRIMETGYEEIRRENRRLALLRGVPESIRVTVEKPSGTSSLVMGVPAGCHWPAAPFLIRRVRLMDKDRAIRQILEAAGVPHEPDRYSHNTEVFSFPLRTLGAGKIRSARDVTVWEQANLALAVAQHWADQAVSVTLTFDPLTRDEKRECLARLRRDLELAIARVILARQQQPRQGDEPSTEVQVAMDQVAALRREIEEMEHRIPEGDDVEHLLACYAGVLKSLTMLPRLDHGYVQAPEEPIDEQAFAELSRQIGTIDWSSLTGDSTPERYCAACEVTA